MGLLDDAIREHLELKRLSGANPGDVARDEQAALGPINRGADAQPNAPQDEDSKAADADESLPPSSEATQTGDSTAGQETIEINMEAELAASDSGHDPADTETAQATGDSLEWEMPGDGDSAAEAEPGSEEPVEDVLEETPDFLRDTPEQERLWFEQRPPRDFDFNE